MLTTLFWNLNGRQHCEPLCANLVRAHAVDLLILAECPRPKMTLRAINAVNPLRRFRWYATANDCRVRVFSRFDRQQLTEIESTQRYCVHALVGPNIPELLVVSVHATSGLREPVAEQEEELRALARRISEIEQARNHTRTLLIGDLNANPFDRRVFAATGLHASRLRDITVQQNRIVKRQRYLFFYNPMWRFLTADPPGTDYHRKATHEEQFWYLFDQALLRPALLPYFADTDVSILTDDGTTSFRDQQRRPDKKVASDHFPNLLKLNYPGV